jgi:hypothetical protein
MTDWVDSPGMLENDGRDEYWILALGFLKDRRSLDKGFTGNEDGIS